VLGGQEDARVGDFERRRKWASTAFAAAAAAIEAAVVAAEARIALSCFLTFLSASRDITNSNESFLQRSSNRVASSSSFDC
jgi:hypothetical protein